MSQDALARVRAIVEGCGEIWNFTGQALGDEGAIAVANQLRGNIIVHEINLRGNRIGPAGAIMLAKRLKSNPALNYLDLSDNELADEGVAALASSLVVNHQLKKLVLAGNKVTDAAVKDLAEALRVNDSLQELNLTGNQLTDTTALALADVCRANRSLEVLHLRNNHLTDLARAAFDDVLLVNSTLTCVYLGRNLDQMSPRSVRFKPSVTYRADKEKRPHASPMRMPFARPTLDDLGISLTELVNDTDSDSEGSSSPLSMSVESIEPCSLTLLPSDQHRPALSTSPPATSPPRRPRHTPPPRSALTPTASAGRDKQGMHLSLSYFPRSESSMLDSPGPGKSPRRSPRISGSPPLPLAPRRPHALASPPAGNRCRDDLKSPHSPPAKFSHPAKSAKASSPEPCSPSQTLQRINSAPMLKRSAGSPTARPPTARAALARPPAESPPRGRPPPPPPPAAAVPVPAAKTADVRAPAAAPAAAADHPKARPILHRTASDTSRVFRCRRGVSGESSAML